MLDDLLDDQKTQPDSIIVHGCCSVQFAKACEQLGHIFGCNSCASVLHVDNQLAFFYVVARFDLNLAAFCELKGVLYQIYHHLRKPPYVAIQFGQNTV